MAKTKRAMKQGSRKRGATKTMKAAMRDRAENRERPRRFPDKEDESLGPPPGTPARGPKNIGRVNAPSRRRDTARRRQAK